MSVSNHDEWGTELFQCLEFLVKYQEPFGDYKAVTGTEFFPCFVFCSPSFINQCNSVDCGLTSVANSLVCILHFQKLTFKQRERYISSTKGKNNAFTLNSEMYVIEPF